MHQHFSKVIVIIRRLYQKLLTHRYAVLFTVLPLIAVFLFLLQYAADASYAAGLADAGEPVIEYVERFHEHAYIANFDSGIFHKSGCFTLPNSDKRVYFDDRDVAVSLGYRPCKNCNP
ncbi:MAG: hypothetical protein KH295_02700 [Clostridiaceae bacterium]|nr:hypothetical protein [Clostridiaceae bacterium]